jgi:hypothetical protein
MKYLQEPEEIPELDDRPDISLDKIKLTIKFEHLEKMKAKVINNKNKHELKNIDYNSVWLDNDLLDKIDIEEAVGYYSEKNLNISNTSYILSFT